MCPRLLWLQELQLGSAAMAHTGRTEWTNSTLLHSEKDVSASETWEECAAADYCSCSADKRTFQLCRLPNPPLATAALHISYAEMYVILLHSILPPRMQLVSWFSKGEGDFPTTQNQPVCIMQYQREKSWTTEQQMLQHLWFRNRRLACSRSVRALQHTAVCTTTRK